MSARKTSAWPLAEAYAALIVYASLYPFSGWRDQGIPPWAFFAEGWPRYWSAFDVVANGVGYVPLGFLLALSVLRRGIAPALPVGNRVALAAAAVAGGTLSLLMEGLQSYLPVRVPSTLDLALNLAGSALGGALAVLLERAGALDHWDRFRDRWFVPDARGALVLLALWPGALLFPASVPLGLGQVMERLEAAVADWLQDTPFLEWVPVRDVELQPLVPAAELVCVALGVAIPCLLAYSVLRTTGRRIAAAALVLALGVGVTALSTALSWGPMHAWAWLSLPVRSGLAAGAAMAALLLPVPRRACAVLLLAALMLHLSLLNQAPANPYFALTLQSWEQGRFIRFNGLAQWLGWLWPFGVLVYVVARLSRRESTSTIAG